MSHKSIERLFRSVFCQFIAVAVLMSLTLTFAVFFSSRETSRIVDSLYYLDEFFSTLKEAQNQAQEILILEREAVSTDLEKAAQDLEALERMQIQGNFSRNMQDLRRMFERYLSMLEKARVWSLTGDVQMQAAKTPGSEFLREMEELAQAIAHKKAVLSGELQDYYARRRAFIRGKLRSMGVFLVLTVLTGFLAIWHNTHRLAEIIVRPVQRLSDQAQQIRGDEISLVHLEGGDEKGIPEEIENLYAAFSHLLGHIAEQMEQQRETMRMREALKEKELENLRVQHLLTQSEFKCLQMQMNPHFLFNTLNMISQTLYLDQKEKSLQLLKETAAFLRYSLDYVGKNVTLNQELEGVGTYVALQEERLGDRVFFEFILDERLGGRIVPCLILQPLVENSLIHGMPDKLAGAQIQIVTRQEEDGSGWIFVRDNGRGIPADQLASLQESLKGNTSLGQDRIGLHNVARRLELFEYCHARLMIDSEEGKGTVVAIHLVPWEKASAGKPKRGEDRKEDKHDQGADRR